MGGRSSEREVSLRSGKRVFESLKSQGFNVISIDLVDDLVEQLKTAKVEIVYNILHGRFGEDGAVQGLLELAGIPYTGSKVLASALAMDKLAAKRVFDAVGIPTPKYSAIEPTADPAKEAARILDVFTLPFILKPVSEGSSVGVSLIKKETGFSSILSQAVSEFKEVFIEEYVKGQEITVGIIGTGKELQALPILELVPKNEFYDYEAKYTAGKTEFILPARLSKELTQLVQATALKAHQALGCYGVSRIDLIVTAAGIPYVHEVNSIPGMTEQSDLPAEAQEAGISFDQLVVKILESAY